MENKYGLCMVLRRHLHATPRGLVELAIITAVLATAEPTLPSLLLGAGVSIAGELVRLWAAGYGPIPDHQPPGRGPFRYLRHPYLFGSVLLFLGLCLAGRNAYVMGAAMVGLTAVYWPAYQGVERRFRASIGPSFAAFAGRVPAVLPRLWPAPSSFESKDSFSLEYALLRGRRRELDALLVYALSAAVLYILTWTAAKQWLHLGVLLAVGLAGIARLVYYGTVRRPGRTGHRLDKPQ